ncbi:hypothetical protein H6P81_000291 [Aristolochia fimbriata]|uniref:WD repeat-containing protein 11 n=1 Tax=Aristolochia fimbriata TaxID=158543 RepID=A0AAV7F3Y3_ARIFI|nr:hypothetical protein H6P81_000291 [Aristolochia fimbriata]
MSVTPRGGPEAWECMLPGPPSRNNGAAADCSTHGLLAYGAGSCVTVVDTRSMQLIAVLPMPGPTPSTLAPFVTSLRWAPQPLPRDLLSHDPSNSHLPLAVGDRQGRVALWDLRSKSITMFLAHESLSAFPDKSKPGVQDLCWIRGDSWLLASVHGPSLLALWNTATGRCVWKYDASPEFFSCVRRDPFDSRHFCAVGIKGFLLSATILGNAEDDVVVSEHQIKTNAIDSAEIQRLEKEAAANPNSPASVVFPTYFVRFGFSPHWKSILFVTFPKELVVFDLQYGTSISTSGLPRGFSKFMDVIPDPDKELMYCAHLDGKLSTWKRKEGQQVHMLCMIAELLPSLGTSVPSPCVLAVVLSPSESTIQNVNKLFSGNSSPSSLFNHSVSNFSSEAHASGTNLLSISDDGKIWKWLLTAVRKDAHLSKSDGNVNTGVNQVPIAEENIKLLDSAVNGPEMDAVKEVEPLNDSGNRIGHSKLIRSEESYKSNLVGQLHLLSSTVSTLAVPSPSLTATLARGGNNPAVAVPLVALGTQSGTIDVIDISSNAVAASFSVHNSIVRGLRWLGNSRLVSFSYIQVNDKAGGYTNRLVVTCVRSGLSRPFRVLQKPERAPIRALRASSSGRYLLILFRDAPVEVWAMTKSPIMLRSLALPFTVLEWTLPTVPRPAQKAPSRQSSFFSREPSPSASPTAASSPKASPTDSKVAGSEGSSDDLSESFSFALVNGALGVFEVHGRRIRDYRPKWPSSSFVSSDGLVTAMAYRLPHVVMGDRSGNIRWWDVTTGLSSSFNTHREGIRRIKFSPVVSGDQSRGRIAVLFYDNTFSIFDLDSQDPLANALLQPQLPGTLVLELDWLPFRTDKDEPLVLCIAGADSSFRLTEINVSEIRSSFGPRPRAIKERFRPMPLCMPILLPTPHALALRMILQLGVKSSWFNTSGTTDAMDNLVQYFPHSPTSTGDLRNYMIESKLPSIGDSVVPEMLLKVLETYRREGCLLDGERTALYSAIVNKGCAARFAFAAAIFGELSEALFWLQLPAALYQSINRSSNKFPSKVSAQPLVPEHGDIFEANNAPAMGKSVSVTRMSSTVDHEQLKFMAFDQQALWQTASERIPWHEKLDGEEAIQKRVHELVSVGNLEAAVSLLLSTPPEGPHFFVNALRAVALSSAVSRSLHELAVKVVAANMVRTDKSLSGTHLLCAVGRYQEACSQLQDAGCWTDAATLAATHLQGSDYARVLQRWGDHVIQAEHNLWRALLLYVTAGALHEALAALRDAQQPDTAALFLLACHEITAEATAMSGDKDQYSTAVDNEKSLFVAGINNEHEDVVAVSEYFGHYQRKLVHLCMDAVPLFD